MINNNSDESISYFREIIYFEDYEKHGKTIKQPHELHSFDSVNSVTPFV